MHFFPCAAFWRRWVTKNKHPGVDGNFSGGFHDGLVKSRVFRFSVIPTEAGIQLIQYVLDAGSSPA
jgi:hypothetical protein